VWNFNNLSFPTGFSEKIPGYPRYTMIGDRTYGTYNLRIQNASLEDDAEFQCQVGPSGNSGPIRTAANLTVICEYFPSLPGQKSLLGPLKYSVNTLRSRHVCVCTP
jgi:hypothetical protein